MTMDRNGVNEYTNDLQDEYTNTTELPKVKIVEQKDDDIALITRLFGTYGEEYTPEEKRRVAEYRARQINAHYKDDIVEYEEDKTSNGPDFLSFSSTATCDCGYCNCNSYPKEQDPAEMLSDDVDFLMEDIRADTDLLLEKMTLLSSKESSPRKVLKAVLGLEIDIALLKQLLLEMDDLNDPR